MIESALLIVVILVVLYYIVEEIRKKKDTFIASEGEPYTHSIGNNPYYARLCLAPYQQNNYSSI